MSWIQQNMGFFVIAAVIALLVLGFFLRRAARNYQNRLIAQSHELAAAGGAAGVAGGHVATQVAKSAASGLETVISFDAPAAQVGAALAAAKMPSSWKLDETNVWFIRGKKVNGQMPSAAGLIDAGEGSQLVLLRSEDIGGIAVTAGAWTAMRTKARAVAAEQGINAIETDGPALERHPVGDVTGLSAEKLAWHQHVWLRPGHTV